MASVNLTGICKLVKGSAYFPTDLNILNRGTIPTFRYSVREEVIDITLCTRSIRDKVKKWRVSDEPSLSDHMQKLYELESHAPSGPTDVDALERVADQNRQPSVLRMLTFQNQEGAGDPLVE